MNETTQFLVSRLAKTRKLAFSTRFPTNSVTDRVRNRGGKPFDRREDRWRTGRIGWKRKRKRVALQGEGERVRHLAVHG